MASRRMLDKNFILSDQFSALPTSAQCLYVRLLVEADDEGFVSNVRLHQRAVGSKGKPLQRLEEAKLVHIFPSGVVLIMHWHIHNKVRKDTFHPTIHQEEKALVALDKTKIYRQKTPEETVQNRNETVPQDSIGKDRKEKDSIDKQAAEAADASGGVCEKNNFDIFWEAYPKKTDRPATEKQFMKTDVPLETLLTALEAQKKSHQWRASNGIYVPNPATWLKNRRWEDQLPQSIPYGGSNHPGEAELEMVRRIMASPL